MSYDVSCAVEREGGRNRGREKEREGEIRGREREGDETRLKSLGKTNESIIRDTSLFTESEVNCGK